MPSIVVFLALAPLVALLPTATLAASGWEPSRQTANELINSGFGVFLFSYVAQGLTWLNWKLGQPWWYRLPREEWDSRYRMGFGSDITIFDIVRYPAAFTVMLGGFAWLVGWAKGTL